MTHPHRINTATNVQIAAGAFLGLIQGLLSVGIPVLLFWLFFGHLLPGAERAAPKPTIEARIDV
jgi:hypothetical protein